MKNRFVVALIYGGYIAVIAVLFDSLSFINSSLNLFLLLITLMALVSLFQFVEFKIIDKFLQEGQQKKSLRVFSYPISVFLGAILTWTIFKDENANLLLFLVAFLISSLLPAMLEILLLIFNMAQSEISLKEIIQTDQLEESTNYFILENESGKVLLKVNMDKLICFEANDNYVIIYYLDKNDQLKKLMERFSLKRMEELLAIENVKFERIHKSFLINPNYLLAIKGKAQAYKLEMQCMEEMLPVSRSYSIQVLESKLEELN